MVWSARTAGILALCLAGCGSGGCGQPSTSTTASSARVTAEPVPAGQVLEIGEPDGDGREVVLPVLTQEALAARVEAQRDLLGKADHLFEDRAGKPVPWISGAGEADRDEATRKLESELLDMLPGSSGLGAMPSDTTSVNGNALGLFVPMEPPEPGASPLASFHEALRRLRAGDDPDGKVRIAMYGGSHTDADVYPAYVRSYLQQRFGDGGHGFVHVAKPWRWYRHVDMAVESSKGWITEHAQRRTGRMDGLYGLMGCSLSSGKRRDFGRVRPRNGTPGSRYELYYLEQPKGGTFQVMVDGNKHGKVKTRADAFGPGYHTIELPEGPHEIEVRPIGNGEVRMFGMTVERDAPGVVVDTLGIGGTRAANHLSWDEPVWTDNIRRRNPDLYMLFYGTNEATDEDQPISVYEGDLRGVLERFQLALPEASCLLVGPGDFPRKLEFGGWAPRSRLLQIVAVQRKVAAEMGCAFWDTLAFMGGPMSMPSWITSSPAMARADGIHFTRRGYVRIGMGIADAMMVDFDAGLL